MRLILTTDVPELGAKGAVVDVANGYGRNFLLPQGLATKATTGAINQIEETRRVKEASRRRELKAATDLQRQLAETRIVIAAQATAQGRLFGSIGVSEVIDAVRSLSQITLERKMISLPAPIKMIGFHEVKLTLHKEVESRLILDVIPA